jgi:hypothetical protein
MACTLVLLVQDAITFIAVVIGTWIMARSEHRKFSSYGLPGRNAFGRRFWEGAVFGYAGVSVLILLLYEILIDSLCLPNDLSPKIGSSGDRP